MMRKTTLSVLAMAMAMAMGCKGGDDRQRSANHELRTESNAAPAAPAVASGFGGESGGTGTAMALEEGKMGGKGDVDDGVRVAQGGRMQAKPADDPAPIVAPGSESSTRAWFPETFLFAPLVVTDDQGRATVPVRVPDRLTTWRILALGHSRSGAQGGAVTTFQSTLPTYVDLVVPPTLVRGDVVRLPIQIVNTTDAAVATALTTTATNATVTGGSGARTVPAHGSLVEYVGLVADRAGRIDVTVALRGGDALVRTIQVAPIGQPITTTRSGTLAAPRTLAITGPAGSDRATDRVRLLAFPGALALLRSELSVATARGGVDDNAYALLLGGRAAALLTALGDTADPDALRTLAIVTGQRAIRDGRSLDVERATLLTEAALAHGASPVLLRLGQRAAAFLGDNQRPDGTFGGGAGWTLQRVLVATADATRAVGTATATTTDRQRAQRVAIRAAAAFERNLAAIEDGYTAAAVLASGALQGANVEQLRAIVRGAITASDDGARFLTVGPGVVRADGVAPGRAEATALAVLALAGDPQAPLADLGATLLGSYDPAHGWADGRANLVAMRAVLELFKAPVPSDVTITLAMDGATVATGVLARDKQKEVLVLDALAPGLAGPHTWTVTADPAVAGLGYALALHSWVPWDVAAQAGGLELSLPGAVTGTVGEPVTIAVRAVAPAGMPLHLRHALPAGVQVDTPSLDALVSAGTVERFVASDGAVDLYVPALAPGATFVASYRVIPTLAGTLHASASSIEGATTTVVVAPSLWTIR